MWLMLQLFLVSFLWVILYNLQSLFRLKVFLWQVIWNMELVEVQKIGLLVFMCFLLSWFRIMVLEEWQLLRQFGRLVCFISLFSSFCGKLFLWLLKQFQLNSIGILVIFQWFDGVFLLEDSLCVYVYVLIMFVLLFMLVVILLVEFLCVFISFR